MASNIIVEKVPQKSPRFNTNVESKSKTLYLELVENADRIQDNLVGKDYVPPVENTLPDHLFPRDIYPDLEPDDSDSEHEPEPEPDFSSTSNLFDSRITTPIRPQTPREETARRITTPIRPQTPLLPPREETARRITTPSRDTISHRQALFGMLKDDGIVNPPNLHALINPVPSPPPAAAAAAAAALGPLDEEEEEEEDNDEENPDDLKRELIFKISLYKKQNPTADIPTFTFADDIKTIEFHYRNCLKLSSVTNTAEKYKTYLIGAFMVVEMVFGKFLKFDMKGFAEEQISKMSSYEALLIELGEKQYVPMESQWSVEVRLLLLVLTNTAMFIAMKMLTSKFGFDVGGIADKIGGVIKNGGGGKNEKRMKGPTFNFDDLEMKEAISDDGAENDPHTHPTASGPSAIV